MTEEDRGWKEILSYGGLYRGRRVCVNGRKREEEGQTADGTRSFFHPQNRDEEIESGGGRIAPGEEGGNGGRRERWTERAGPT